MSKGKIEHKLVETMAKADKMAFGAGRVITTDSLLHANHIMDEGALRCHEDINRGRGAALNPRGRFENIEKTPQIQDDESFKATNGFDGFDDFSCLKTHVQSEKARSIITHNQSPDIVFDRSINPYRGCEHGCIYCFARPSHSYMGLSAGLDFETQLFAKENAAEVLEQELSNKNYKPKTIAIGTNTDPYQPIEKQHQLMRQILEVLDKANHPVAIVTKSALIVRDIDILSNMAKRNLVKVALSVTTLDSQLARAMEPRAATPKRRLWAISQLSKANIPVSVLVAPMILGLNDHEMEEILQKAHEAGAINAAYLMLRLPFEVAPLFKDWLLRNYPNRYRRVMQMIRDMRGGKDYDAKWHTRMFGQGVFSELMAKRFRMARKRLNMGLYDVKLTTALFLPPLPPSKQLSLFDL